MSLHKKQIRNKKEFVPVDWERAEKIREVLHYLYEINKLVPIIVEGKKDKKALRDLGFDGEIITLHSGKSIYEFAETIANKYEKIILLFDWDSKGEELYSKVGEELQGMWEEFASIRELLKLLCQKEIAEVEDIPSLFKRIAGYSLDVRQWEE
ncbi:5S rRNA maturation endonuclease [Thermodesulfovibrio aggregans]|uniref:5S rRNA maturation endonuclease n=1 Tax=Thermodesulfovibrio aggregans TaxID=86166 RepID=A0A0U9HM91_9BACT|nr:toprim domain-containing protein [Thermodesulfovibrio aggregans]GAQ94200.1 5S rRNA maturation endonuclease [Thermodesulfovibrio aggregans]